MLLFVRKMTIGHMSSLYAAANYCRRHYREIQVLADSVCFYIKTCPYIQFECRVLELLG